MSNRQSLHFSTSPAFIDSLQSPIRFMSLQNKKVKYKGLGLCLSTQQQSAVDANVSPRLRKKERYCYFGEPTFVLH